MADDYNRLAMFSAPADQVNMLAQQLPAGHPSNMLRSLRDWIPQVQADDSSTMSGIYSRLGRTATAIPRAGLETMANWLQGTHDPNAVRIGEDTIAPFGLFGMTAGLAAKAPRAAAMADNAKSSVPGTVVNAMGDRSFTELTDTPPRFRPDRSVAATENNPYVAAQGSREGTNYFALDEAGKPIGYASTTTHPIGVRVEGVEVAPSHRGQGVANNLYDTIEQRTGMPVRPSGTLSDDGLRLWQGRDPEAVQWHQSLPSEPGWNYSPRELKRMADDRGHAGAREAFDSLPPEARSPERLSTMFADNAKSSVPGTVVNAMGEQPQTIRAYHGTNAKFDRFDPSYTDEVGFHFGSKEQAEARLRDKADEEGRRRLPWPLSNERTIPVDIEAKKILDLKEDPNSFGGDLLSLRMLLDEHMPRSKYDEVQGMVRAGRDADATAAVRQWIVDNGYDVVRYPNKVEGVGAQPSYMTMGTGNVRDVKTGKVLFSASASAPGAAASASQPPQDDGVTEILRRYGLLGQ